MLSVRAYFRERNALTDKHWEHSIEGHLLAAETSGQSDTADSGDNSDFN
ncbi:MAG: hypothetical protein AAF722_08445 [Cyanobacteria bacterium P01_C01_bin.70]